MAKNEAGAEVRASEMCGGAKQITRKLKSINDAYISGCGAKAVKVGKRQVTLVLRYQEKLERAGRCKEKKQFGNNPK